MQNIHADTLNDMNLNGFQFEHEAERIHETRNLELIKLQFVTITWGEIWEFHHRKSDCEITIKQLRVSV